MSELPETWCAAKIGDLCELINGRAFKPDDWGAAGLPIVRIQNLNDSEAPFNHYDGEVRERFLIDSGDLLFAWSGTPGTSFGAHVWRGGKAILNQHIFNVLFNKQIVDRDFFRLAINQKLDELINKAHGGVGLRHVTKGKFEETEIALPPPSEQRRIVAKLDQLFERTRSAREELAHIPTLVEHYKQAIIDQAFSRLADRRPLHELVIPERGIPYGIVQTGTPFPGGIPTIRCGDIKGFRIDRQALKLVSPDIESAYQRTRLAGGEVLIAIRGSVGETCVASEELIGCNISREVAMIPLRESTLPRFAMYFLASTEAKMFISGNVKGVAQQGINLRDLRNLPSPVCSLEQQSAVLRRIDAALNWIERIVGEHDQAATLIDHLDSALLSKAFRGELVPQDAADEPAERLLERIRSKRGAQAPARRGRKARVGA